MTRIHRAAVAVLATAVLASAAGCGFIAAGQKSIQKPTTFVLIGHADVTLPATDHRAVGVACTSPPAIAGIGPATQVKVLDADGRAIALGSLGNGVTAHSAAGLSCDFPFDIAGVPGGSDSYGVAVGDQPAQSFPAAAVRQNAPAVITIAS